MKFFKLLILCLAAAAFSMPAAAEEPVAPKFKGSATVAYWMGKYSMEAVGSSSDSSNQKFIPIVNADFKYEQNLDIAVEFGDAKRSKVSRDGVEDQDYTVRSERRLIGLKYKIPGKPGSYASVSWRSNKFNLRDFSAPVDLKTVKVKGVRLGIGTKHKLKDKPYTLNADFGYGIMAKADIKSSRFGAWNPNVKTIDGNLGVTLTGTKYKYRPLIGYRFENNDISSYMLNGVAMPGISIKNKGIYLGAEFEI